MLEITVVVDGCLCCHMQTCIGPIERINKRQLDGLRQRVLAQNQTFYTGGFIAGDLNEVHTAFPTADVNG